MHLTRGLSTEKALKNHSFKASQHVVSSQIPGKTGGSAISCQMPWLLQAVTPSATSSAISGGRGQIPPLDRTAGHTAGCGPGHCIGRVDVSETASISTGIASRYATAVFDLATEDNALTALEADLATLEAALADSEDLRDLIASPIYSRSDMQAGIAAVASAMGTHLDLFQRIVVSPCSVTAILYTPDGPIVLAVNSTGDDLKALVPS